MIFFIRKKFSDKKFPRENFYRYIIRKIILKISKFTIALCVNVCYYNSVVRYYTTFC